MRRALLGALLVGSAGVWWAAPAAAASLGISVKSPVSGSNQPAIVLTPSDEIKSIACTLHRDDQKQVKVSAGAIAAGGEQRFEVKQEAGSSHTYKAECKVKWGDGKDGIERFQFTAARMAKLKLSLDTKDVDLDARTLSLTMNNPAKKVEVTIKGAGGKTLQTVEKTFADAKPGTKLEVAWKPVSEAILYIEVKAWDEAGFWQGVRLTPAQMNVDGEAIEFDTAKWDIRKSEEPKLKRTLDKIQDGIAKFKKAGANLEFRVYVAGYTDTVGDKGSNRTLSNNRARAIASWFRQKGLKVPIYYQGFGEDVLAKKTPDETEEQANRRVLYTIATQHPTGPNYPKSNWGRL